MNSTPSQSSPRPFPRPESHGEPAAELTVDETMLDDEAMCTAYALGALTPEQVVTFEARMNTDDALRAEVDAIRATAGQLEAALREEPAPGLTDAQRIAIEEGRSAPAVAPDPEPPVIYSISRSRGVWATLAAAACIGVVVVIPFMLPRPVSNEMVVIAPAVPAAPSASTPAPPVAAESKARAEARTQAQSHTQTQGETQTQTRAEARHVWSDQRTPTDPTALGMEPAFAAERDRMEDELEKTESPESLDYLLAAVPVAADEHAAVERALADATVARQNNSGPATTVTTFDRDSAPAEAMERAPAPPATAAAGRPAPVPVPPVARALPSPAAEALDRPGLADAGTLGDVDAAREHIARGAPTVAGAPGGSGGTVETSGETNGGSGEGGRGGGGGTTPDNAAAFGQALPRAAKRLGGARPYADERADERADEGGARGAAALTESNGESMPAPDRREMFAGGADIVSTDTLTMADVNARLPEVALAATHARRAGDDEQMARLRAEFKQLLARKRQLVSEARTVVDETTGDHGLGDGDTLVENQFRATGDQPHSTLRVQTDDASYATVRRHLREGRLPSADVVRIEEMINHFAFDYAEPDGETPVAVNVDLGDCPWNADHRLARIGVQRASTPTPAVRDVRIHVAFDPSRVASHRLIGYADREGSRDDFYGDLDDTTNAGRLDAHRSLTVLYELALSGVALEEAAPARARVNTAAASTATNEPERRALLDVRLSFAMPDGTVDRRTVASVDSMPEGAGSDPDFDFAAAVAAAGLLLRDSPHKGDATWAMVLELASRSAAIEDRAEFIALVRRAMELTTTER